jgi:hypothetical protein
MPESPGWLIAGQYRLIEQVGRGGFAIVWRARDERLRRDVAAKQLFLPPRFTDEQRRDHRTWTLREARSAARLAHPGVVTVHDVVEHDGIPWIIMEFVPGRTLGEIVRTDGPLPPARAAEIGLQLVEALRAAHAAGVVHRDVKPGNVIVGAGRVVLGDFGIAQVEGDPELTESGIVMGAAAYTAPERARGEPAVAASDLWSLGATLFYAVEGRRPFGGPSPSAVLQAVLTRDPAPTRRAGPLARVLDGLLRKDVATRMNATEAAELLSLITAYERPRPAAAVAPDPPDREARSTATTGTRRGNVRRLYRRLRDRDRDLQTTTITATGRLRMPRRGFSAPAIARRRPRSGLRGQATGEPRPHDVPHETDSDPRGRTAGPAAGDPRPRRIPREADAHEGGSDPRGQGTGPAAGESRPRRLPREASSWPRGTLRRRGFRAGSVPPRRPIMGAVSLAGIMALLMGSAFGEGDARRTMPGPAGVLPSLTGTPLDLAFSPDGRTLVAGSAENSVRRWNVAGRHGPAVNGGPSARMVFSPDGRLLATGGDRRVHLWDAGGHRLLATVPVPGGPVGALAFSPDGRTLACAGGTLVLLWNTTTGSPAATLDAHTRTVEAVAFSPDGRLLATALDDATVRLWRLA